ncbi:MAG: adenylate/guanylate cyclase domain-containing protein [Gammaproteobacteria bacterium]|nr:adenylate/guanylate cyclase domain-containing protein [Gammaproteobacteria bacterium]
MSAFESPDWGVWGMSGDLTDNQEILQTFRTAEQTGLRLAIIGKLAAIGLVVLWLLFSRGRGPAAEVLVVGFAFAGLGLVHYRIISSPWDRPWVKYLFLGLDVAFLSILVGVAPVEPRVDLPQAFIFRFNIFPYYFLIVAIAGLSFSPGLVLWAGVAGSAGWLSAYAYIFAMADNPLQWSDIPSVVTQQQFYAVFLSPAFLPGGSRLQEVVVLLVTAALLTVVMHRARATVYAHLHADAERQRVSNLFGRHVPRAVADMMISDKGALQPIEREATVLFADIEGFTSLTETLGPTRITRVLNAYFDDATRIISDHGGVITQFQGDAILAIFNVPVANPDHAQKAVDAAQKLSNQTRLKTYSGESLSIRIGIDTGNLIAGNVGGGGRQTYTVHGDVVNAAARLEAMNKKLGTSILLSGATAGRLTPASVKRIGKMDVRGQRAQTEVFTTDLH